MCICNKKCRRWVFNKKNAKKQKSKELASTSELNELGMPKSEEKLSFVETKPFGSFAVAD